MRKQKQKITKLRDGDAIKMQLPGDKQWSLGRVIGNEGNRSYLAEVNGKQYRRNRRWVRATAEELEPSEANELIEQTEPTKASSDELALPIVPSTPVASEPHTASRPTRERCPPLWLQDYEC